MGVIQIIQFLLTLQSKYTTGKLNTIQSTENFHKQLNALKQTPLNLHQQLIKAAKYYVLWIPFTFQENSCTSSSYKLLT